MANAGEDLVRHRTRVRPVHTQRTQLALSILELGIQRLKLSVRPIVHGDLLIEDPCPQCSRGLKMRRRSIRSLLALVDRQAYAKHESEQLYPQSSAHHSVVATFCISVL